MKFLGFSVRYLFWPHNMTCTAQKDTIENEALYLSAAGTGHKMIGLYLAKLGGTGAAYIRRVVAAFAEAALVRQVDR